MPSENEALRCAAHDLAADAHGQCVVCRRASQPLAAPAPATPEPSLLASRLLTWLLALLAAASLGVVVTLRMLETSDAAGRTSAVAENARNANPRGLAGSSASRVNPQDLARGASSVDTKSSAKAVPEPRARGVTRPDAKLAQQPQPAGQTLGDQLRQQQSEQAAQKDAERHAQIEAQLNAQALAAARRNVSVEMFSTSWCGVCRTARRYMQAHAIGFVDHDIDQDELARTRAQQLNPRLSVPVIDVGGQVMIGFSERTLEDNIDRAARKRIGL